MLSSRSVTWSTYSQQGFFEWHNEAWTNTIDEAGQPTIAARDEILAFFAHRLAS